MHHSSLARVVVAAGLFVPFVVLAKGIFPDVSDNYLYKQEIESLAREGIVKGNLKGHYEAERSINRAEFLKLLYTATGRIPSAISGCFTDVEIGSWYEHIVCDAASSKNRFVSGYSDGKFRPSSSVTRTEALKMIVTVFGFPAEDVSSASQSLLTFVDISVSAWYSKYIIAAYNSGILPIAGQSGSKFFPEKDLIRGEAAAYIFNAKRAQTQGSSSSSADTSTSTSSRSSSVSSSSSSSLTSAVHNVSFPFNDSSVFVKKIPVSYVFTLTDAKTIFHADIDVVGFYPSDVTCRLYFMKEDGFSDEYYLGVQSKNTCRLHVALRPGQYQLQIQPVVADVAYTVKTSVGTTDGNDGFLDAVKLTKGKARTFLLESNDLYDWYSVTPLTNQTVTVGITSSVVMSCIIYTPPSVDQFGFTGPQCGVPYTFVGGETYIIGIGRKNVDVNSAVTYTVQWQ